MKPCMHQRTVEGCRICFLYDTRADYKALWDKLPNMQRQPKPTGCTSCGKKKQLPPCAICDNPDPLNFPENTQQRWRASPATINQHKAALLTISERNYQPPPLEGDGVVLCGEGKYWPGLVVAVKMLRHVGSNLPVQIWHNGDIGDELKDEPNIKFIDARAFRTKHPARILRGWEIKTYAILHSGFRRVLYLDADAYTVADPKPLFDLLANAPFVFWSDLSNCYNNVKWDYYPLNGQQVPAIQGGQLLMDLEQFWRETMIAHWMNNHSDYFYHYQYGDQDSWRVALALTQGRYCCVDKAHWSKVAFICSYDKKEYIVHRCGGKMFLPWEGHTAKKVPALPLEGSAHKYYWEQTHPDNAALVFEGIYKRKTWGEGSGQGSHPREAKPYVDWVNEFLKDKQSVVDLGCGDGRIACQLKCKDITAVDVYSPLLETGRKAKTEIKWLCLDIDKEREALPTGEVALMKDVLHHWPNTLVVDWLVWAIKSKKWRYIVLCQDRKQPYDNHDCHLGGYRGLNPNMLPLSGFPMAKLQREFNHKAILLIDTSENHT